MSSGERSIAVVGGGFAGVGAAAMLDRAGYRDVVVFERAERVGGVWQANTYPGAACDIPSHLYEFSFAPNPRWSRRYAPRCPASTTSTAPPSTPRAGTTTST
jgi:cation diffusion facilitator CzcD-associated flavoprotein CzcO